jgi:hypothetical protein
MGQNKSQLWAKMGLGLKQYHKGRIQVMGQQRAKKQYRQLWPLLMIFFFFPLNQEDLSLHSCAAGVFISFSILQCSHDIINPHLDESLLKENNIYILNFYFI